MTSATDTSTGGKDLSLEGIRGFAAVMVLACHTVVAYRPSLYDAYWPRLTHDWEKVFVASPLRLLIEGNVAVCLFFILSGQVLTRGAFTSPTSDLSGRLLRRPIRLGIPLLAVNLLVLALLDLGWLDGFQHPQLATLWWVAPGTLTVSSAAYSAFYGTLFQGDVRWQIVHWSLRFELYGSFLAIGTASVIRLRSNAMAIMAGIALLVGWLWSPYYSAFIVGAMCSLYFDTKKQADQRSRRHGGSHALYFFAASFLTLFGIFMVMRPPNSFGPWLQSDRFIQWLGMPDLEATSHVIGASVIYVVLLTFNASRSALSRPTMVRLGEASFGIYLLHIPFLYAVTWRIEDFLTPQTGRSVAALMSALATVILVPFIAYFAFRPIDRLAVRVGARLVPPLTSSNRLPAQGSPASNSIP